MEVIGTYDPIPKSDPYDHSGKLHKDIKLDVHRARYWIGVGAQPSDTAWRILSMVSTLSVFNMVVGTRKSVDSLAWKRTRDATMIVYAGEIQQC